MDEKKALSLPERRSPETTEAVIDSDHTRPAMTIGDDGLYHSYHLKNTGDNARNWDFVSRRTETHLSTVPEGVANLIKSCLGGGVVAIHTAYSKIGLWAGLGLNIVLGMFVSYMMIVLAKCAQKTYGRVEIPAMSYPDVMEAVCDITRFKRIRRRSRFFRHLVDATIMFDLFGSCCVYQVIIGEQFKQILSTYLSTDLNLRLIIFMTWLPCILVCLILKLKYLAWCSILADIILVAVAISTVVYGAKDPSAPLSDMVGFTSLRELVKFMGVCVFSMEGVGVTLPVENTLKRPHRISLVLTLGMTVVVSIVICVGFFGCWGFGHNAHSPVTLNFPPADRWAIILKVALPYMIYITFGLNFWVPFRLVWAYFIHKYPTRTDCAERVHRAILVTIITAIAVAFPAVDDLIGVIGSFCLSNMGFIYPAFMELLLDYDDPGLGRCKWRLLKFILILIFGIFLMIFGTVFNVISLINKLLGKDG